MSRQVEDEDVSRLIKRLDSQRASSSPASSHSASGQDVAPPPAEVWSGYYYIDLKMPPAKGAVGWTAGRLSASGKQPPDLILSVQNSSLHAIRNNHARLQFHHLGRIFIQRISDRAIIEVDGESLPPNELRVLNHKSATIRFGQLKYHIEYGRNSDSPDHTSHLQEYINALYVETTTIPLAFTPTPVSGGNIQVGQWILTQAGTIGVGAYGRVSAAINKKGDFVALKRCAVTSFSAKFQRQRTTLKTLARITEDAGEERIVRLLEVITDDPRGQNRQADVWFVFTPFVARTLADGKGSQKYETLLSPLSII